MPHSDNTPAAGALRDHLQDLLADAVHTPDPCLVCDLNVWLEQWPAKRVELAATHPTNEGSK